MADSGTYDPETIARHQKIADILLQQAVKAREIRSPLQGIGQLGEAAIAGYSGYQADKEGKDARAEALAQALQAFGGGGAAPAGGQPPVAAPMAAPGGGGIADRIVGAESGGDPNAANPNSSARGLGQFISSTWLDTIKNSRPDLASGKSDADLLAMRSDPALSRDMTQAYANQNGQQLASAGLPVTPGTTYLAHFAGPGGAQSALRADPAASVASVLGNNVVKANPFLANMTVGDLKDWADKKMGGGAAPAVAAVLNAPQPAAGGPSQSAPPPVPQQVAQNAPVPTAGPQGGNRDAIIRALMNPWTPPAMAGILAQQGFQKPELKDAGTDPITGQKSYQEYDPVSHTMRPVNGAPGTAQAQSQPGMLAQGVSQIDHTLSGDAYLKQFGPEIQSAVKSYMNGDVLPSGNPRLQGIANAAKTIAQKYGQDTGQPVSDSLYSEKRKYRTELGSNTPSTAGGQAKAFNQGIEHMGALATTLEKLDNSSGFGIPILADAANAVRQGTSTEQSAVADKARSIGQTLAGEVGKLFSGSAGGGVEERRMTRDRFDTVKSPAQLAAALEATLETMRGGLTALEGRRDQVLGPKNDVKFVTPDTEKKIAQIEGVIARLKGGKAEAAPATTEGTQGGLPPGWTVKVH